MWSLQLCVDLIQHDSVRLNLLLDLVHYNLILYVSGAKNDLLPDATVAN